MIEEIVKTLTIFPVQLRDKCSQLSPGFLYYDECEQACDSDRFYSDCIKMCESGDSPGGWSCLTGCRALDAALKKRSGDCPEQIGLAIHRIPDLISVQQTTQSLSGKERSSFSEKSLPLDQSGSHQKSKTPDNSRFAHHSSSLNELSSCLVDAECPQKQDKCCQSKCKPAVLNKAILPPIPTVRILEEKHPPSFFVSWDDGESVVNNLSLPVVYVLQVKSYFGPEYDNRMSSPWKTLVMSTLKGAQLSDPAVGWWYQFQVAAVNQWGSLGFDVPSPPVQLSTPQPSPPSPPRDLADEMLTVQANGKIKVQIRWSSPATIILPVTEYRVSWGPDLANIRNNYEFTEKPTQFVHTVPSSQTSYQLINLYPGVLYRIQVIAMSEWGTTQLRSQPNTLFIHTPSVDSVQEEGDIALNTYLKNFESNTQYQKGVRYPTFFSGTSSKENPYHFSSEQDGTFVCNGTSKSFVFKGPLSHESLRPLNTKTTELSIKTDAAIFDGRDLMAELTIFENEVFRDHKMESDQQKVNSRPILVRWTPQVCIETVIVTGNNLEETASFQSEALIANNLDQFSKHSHVPTEKDSGRKGSLKSNEKYILLNPLKKGSEGQSGSSKQMLSVLRYATLQLTNLYFNCRYLIELLAENRDSSQQSDTKFPSDYSPQYNVELSAWLCTPTCSAVKLASWIKKPNCPGATQVLDIITEPKNVSYKQISVVPTISYNISWKSGVLKPRYDGPVYPTTKEDYSGKSNKILFPVHHRIIWGPSRDTGMKSVVWKSWPNLRPRIDQSRAETKVLRNSETFIVLDNLLPSTLYVVSLQAMTAQHYITNAEDIPSLSRNFMKPSIVASQTIAYNTLQSNKPSTKYYGTSKEVHLVFETPSNVNTFSHLSQEFTRSSINGASKLQLTMKERICRMLWLSLVAIRMNCALHAFS
ncbi:unnamed protein product [Heterobilharzia americana]|nr:unnamed protein product [Heterobilharzia americana]